MSTGLYPPPVKFTSLFLWQLTFPKCIKLIGFPFRDTGSYEFNSQWYGQDSDQMELHSGGIHSSAVTGTGTLSFPRETSTLWSDSHPSTTVASKTALEPRVRSSVPTVSTRFSVPPVHPMVDKYGKPEKRSSVRNFRCGVLPVHIHHYSKMGCSYAEFNNSRHMDRWAVQMSCLIYTTMF